MTDTELLEAIHAIAEDQRPKMARGWSVEEQASLFREIRRLNLGPQEEHLWGAHYQACERGGDFPPVIVAFIADLRYQIRQKAQWNEVVAGVLPQPTGWGKAELDKYLQRIGVGSLLEAAEHEWKRKVKA